jgi:nicotinamidase-related amidase
MPIEHEDLHGNAPDKSPVVLLLIDMINDFDYPGGEDLLAQALPAARNAAALRKSAKSLGIPVIFVNDNYGKWKSDINRLYKHVIKDNVRGKQIAKLMKPDEEDYFVLKPKHSGFYCTTLDLLLKHLRAKTLILTGIAGNSCILFTANDAYLREFRLVVPADCTASIDPVQNEYALNLMQNVLKADTRKSTEIDLKEIIKQADNER